MIRVRVMGVMLVLISLLRFDGSSGWSGGSHLLYIVLVITLVNGGLLWCTVVVVNS